MKTRMEKVRIREGEALMFLFLVDKTLSRQRPKRSNESNPVWEAMDNQPLPLSFRPSDNLLPSWRLTDNPTPKKGDCSISANLDSQRFAREFLPNSSCVSCLVSILCVSKKGKRAKRTTEEKRTAIINRFMFFVLKKTIQAEAANMAIVADLLPAATHTKTEQTTFRKKNSLHWNVVAFNNFKRLYMADMEAMGDSHIEMNVIPLNSKGLSGGLIPLNPVM